MAEMYMHASMVNEQCAHDLVQPSRMVNGRWVPSTPSKGGSPFNSPFGRPSKGASNTLLASQSFSNQPYKASATVPSHGSGPVTGPIIASWDASVPTSSAQNLAASSSSRLPSSAPISGATNNGASSSRWSGFTRLFRARQPHMGSGALLDHADPVLSSVAEIDPETGVVDASLHAYHSTDLDASNAASSANRLWAITAPSLSPRRAASQASDRRTDSFSQAGPSQGSYPVPSPWSTPTKPPQSSASSPSTGSYPVPSPQSKPLGQPQSQTQSPAVSVGPFQAAALARAAQARDGSSPGDSFGSASSSQANPILSPANSGGDGRSHVTPGGSASRALSAQSTPSRPGYPVLSPATDWSTGISGMRTTKAARPSSAGARRKKL